MENSPQRREAWLEMRASDADRDRTIQILGEALAMGRLTVYEHSERLDAVYLAKTIGELEPITRDLPQVAGERKTPVAPAVDPDGSADGTDTMIAVFGGTRRTGRWRVRRRSKVVTVFGGVDLDMTSAVFDAPVVEIKMTAVFGGINITLPEGVEVRNEAIGIFGGIDAQQDDDPPLGAPVLVIKGFALFGGASIAPKRKSKKT
ncbi:DUF1707 SHOCT-like domain-containing protein [Rhizohabitans arisaemae]|uniref:DUF1707 SHOCT-like domain-containing protein n=1 Tax=Rhizohabitans arisaemae TaxID=2720610 RepID=UPI0024B1870F|nr:DUF1707 domain-containing protein [Rhizohabitans arisaemae]